MPCFAPAIQLHRKLCKQGCYAQAAALQRVIVGGCMDGERFAKAGFDGTFVCELCGVTGAGPIHKYWTCSMLNTLPDEDQCISKSQHLKDKAVSGFGKYPCLWGRGILPHDFWNVDEQAPSGRDRRGRVECGR